MTSLLPSHPSTTYFNITHTRHKNVKISHYFKKTLEQFLIMFITEDTWLTVMIVEGHSHNHIQGEKRLFIGVHETFPSP